MSPLSRATSWHRGQDRAPQSPLPPCSAGLGAPKPAFPPLAVKAYPHPGPPSRPDGPARDARPPAVTMLASGPPNRGAPRARLPEGWRLPGVYSCPSAAAGFSRVLGRRSAPSSGSNCGPGVRQPSSRDRGSGVGALQRPGTRAAEGSPVASGGRAPSEETSVGPTRAIWTQRRSCLLSCGNCAAAPRMRTAAAAYRGSSVCGGPG